MRLESVDSKLNNNQIADIAIGGSIILVFVIVIVAIIQSQK